MTVASEQKKILVAEDEKPLAKALKLKLEKEGFIVTSVSDGEAAIRALTNDLDLVFLDLMMPKKNGFDVLRAAKEKKFTAPIVVLTNLSQETDMNLAKELGAIDYLVKSDTPLVDVVALAKNKIK